MDIEQRGEGQIMKRGRYRFDGMPLHPEDQILVHGPPVLTMRLDCNFLTEQEARAIYAALQGLYSGKGFRITLQREQMGWEDLTP